MKKFIAALMCGILVFAAGCWSAADITQDIVLSRTGSQSGAADGLYTFGYGDNMTVGLPGSDGGLNSPDPSYYAPKYVYSALGADVMPILGYVEPRIADERYLADIDDTFRDFANSGANVMINSVYSAGGDGVVLQMLDYAEKHGLMFLIKYGGAASAGTYGTLDEAAARIASDLREYVKYKSFGGLHVVDEPGWYSWTGKDGDYSEAVWPVAHQAYNKVFNNTLFYINLLPIYSPTWAFTNGANGGSHEASTDYNYYYRTYVENVKPKVFSYDYYPLSGPFPQLKNQHFYQIALSKKYAEMINVPFWCFIQVCDWTGGAGRIANYSEIAWQVNTALAFGVKGIQYFTYGTYSPDGNWLGAMISFDGTVKNQSYYDVQKVNRHIAGVDHILLNSISKGVIQYGLNPNGEIISAEQGRLQSYGRYSSSRGVNHLIGCMEYYPDNNQFDPNNLNPVKEEAFYVLNNTLNRSGDVEITFDSAVSGEWYYNGQRTAFENTVSLTFALRAGEAALVHLNN